MKASDLFVKALEAENVEYIFGIPGEENLDMLDSLSRSLRKRRSIRMDGSAWPPWSTICFGTPMKSFHC